MSRHPAFHLVLGLCACLAFVASGTGASRAQTPDKPDREKKTQTPSPGAKPAVKRPSIYDKNADAQKQLADAAAKARRENKRVLVMFGGDWCGWCHRLHGLFASDAAIHKLLSYEYELVMVDTEAPHAQNLLKGASKGQDHVGFPFLAVFDGAGTLLVGQKTDPLEEGDHHDPKKVKDFLARWVAEPLDAEALVRDALARVSSDDRKLFLTFGAPWCGWCHRLENFLARPEILEILDRDFQVLKIDIDRMKHGKDVMERFRSEESRNGGIPWVVVVSGKGEALATSDLLPGPVKNIGYPAEPREIDAFLTLVSGQARRIDAGQLATLRNELSTAGKKILDEMKARTEARKAASH